MKATERREDRKGDRIGEEDDAGEWWRHREEHDEHRVTSTENQSNSNFIKNNILFVSYNFAYIEIEKSSYGRRRIAVNPVREGAVATRSIPSQYTVDVDIR